MAGRNRMKFKNILNDAIIKKNTVFPFFLLLITGCQFSREKTAEQTTDNVYRVDVASCIDHKSEMKISEIACEIEYIALETKANNLIREIQKVQFTENFIFAADENGLYQFSDRGKFIRQIGSLGLGPGEHSAIMNFAVNEKANIVIVQGTSSIAEYDLEGNYVKNIRRFPGQKFEFIDKDRIVFYKANNINSPVNLIITSLDLEPVREFYNLNPKAATNYSLSGAPLYHFKDHLYFKEHWNDTLFCIQDSVLEPHIIFNESELLLDKNFEIKSSGSVSDLVSQMEKVEDKIMTDNILESERFVFISYRQGINPRTHRYVRVLFDKDNSITCCLNNGEFINDIDGGLDFYPQLIADSRVLVQWLNAYSLKAHIASPDFAASVSEDTSLKNKLEILGSSLKDTDNPVLMLVKLKE